MASGPPPPIAELAARRTALLYTASSVLAMFWLPLVLIINPGWLTLFLFSPFALLLIGPPLAVFLSIKWLRQQAVQPPYRWLILGFFLSWLLTGLCFTNFGDTEDSVQSILSRLLSSAAPHDTLVTISSMLGYPFGLLAFGLSIALFCLTLARLRKAKRP